MRLVVENLSKEYGGAQRVRALSNVQFSLGPGVLGLLGPSGAGKSTPHADFGDDYSAVVGTRLVERRGHPRGSLTRFARCSVICLKILAFTRT